jgi:hypothetical protein
VRYVAIYRNAILVAYVHMREDGTFNFPFRGHRMRKLFLDEVVTASMVVENDIAPRRRPRDTVQLLPGPYRGVASHS